MENENEAIGIIAGLLAFIFTIFLVVILFFSILNIIEKYKIEERLGYAIEYYLPLPPQKENK